MLAVIAMIARAAVLALALLAAWLAVALIRRYLERRRAAVLAAPPPADALAGILPPHDAAKPIHILAFSSADCSPCHTLQAPALERVRAARGARVAVVTIDAPSAPELTSRYAVLTVPTTVVLDATGRARAVNYGFANERKLLAQVDAALGSESGTAKTTHVEAAR